MPVLPTRRLGASGPEVSIIGLGCNNFGRRLDREGTRAAIDAALDGGITFLDTADIYGDGRSETFLGELLEGRRDQVVLATKFGMRMYDTELPRGSRDYIMRALEGSLTRLRTDRIDVYWYHQPDGVTPIADTLAALDELVRAGTVGAIGASNFSASQLAQADATARERGLTPFTALQNEYSLLVRDAERDVLPECERLGIGFVPYYPLASGLLSGKYRRHSPPPAGARLSGREQIATPQQFDLIEALQRFAAERGVSPTAVALGALLARAVVASVIAGATRPEQVEANLEAVRWHPSAEELAALDGMRAR